MSLQTCLERLASWCVCGREARDSGCSYRSFDSALLYLGRSLFRGPVGTAEEALSAVPYRPRLFQALPVLVPALL